MGSGLCIIYGHPLLEIRCLILRCEYFADPPEIELETDRVHSGENKEAHLTCIIHGNPEPTVRKHF